MRRLSSTSRYVNVVAAGVTDVSGTQRYAFELREPVDKSSLGDDFVVVTTLEGDQLDALADRHLGDARLWWVLADLNRDVLEDALRLEPNTRLVVPTSWTA